HGSNNVSGYVINSSTGVLTQVPGSPFAAGTQPRFVQLEPSAKFAYVVNSGSNDIWTYTVNSGTGALTPIAPGKLRARQGPMGIGFVGGSLPVTYTPKFAYVANNYQHDVSGYTISATSGALTPVPGSPFAAKSRPVSVAVDPTGRFAYVTNSNS